MAGAAGLHDRDAIRLPTFVTMKPQETRVSGVLLRQVMTEPLRPASADVASVRAHLRLAPENGLSRQELAEAITHLAFYAGWPTR